MEAKLLEKTFADPKPAYLFKTKQDYIKKVVRRAAEAQVEDAARAFDWAHFDLKEDPVDEVVTLARTLPWLSEKRWIYVANASEAGEGLTGYLKKPADHTVLILESPKLVEGWPRLPVLSLDKELSASSWVRQRVRNENFKIDSRAAALLVESVGEDLQRLRSELEKLLLLEMDTRNITTESVKAVVVEAREHDVFELIGAIALGRQAEAMRLLNRLVEQGTSPQQIIALLSWTLQRLLVAWERLRRGQPFFGIVKDLKIWSFKNREREIRQFDREFLVKILLELRRTDRLCKSTSVHPRIHLDSFVFRLLQQRG